MKLPDGPLLLLVRQWIGKGEIDYQTAERLLRDEEPIRESIAFHCQQAVEKYLKAVLVARQTEFPKTHSIAQLLDLISGFAPALAATLEDTIPLTPFGVQIRYPGDFVELLPGQEREVFDLAKKARQSVLQDLDQFLGGG
ncbi:MAG: HEPN domain-containing protein [Bryobacteraceae bacterium]